MYPISPTNPATVSKNWLFLTSAIINWELFFNENKGFIREMVLN